MVAMLLLSAVARARVVVLVKTILALVRSLLALACARQVVGGEVKVRRGASQSDARLVLESSLSSWEWAEYVEELEAGKQLFAQRVGSTRPWYCHVVFSILFRDSSSSVYGHCSLLSHEVPCAQCILAGGGRRKIVLYKEMDWLCGTRLTSGVARSVQLGSVQYFKVG